ncbi:MAG: dihydrolipoamide acetyltransferase family protein [Chloroflexota bacterium]
MSTPIKMPQFGESVVEGTVARWLKQPGDAVEKMEPLLEVSTDKIDTEIPAPISGILLQIAAAEGETVAAGTVIGMIGTPGEKVADAAALAPVATVMASDAAQTNASLQEDVLPDVNHQQDSASSPTDTQSDSTNKKPSGRDFISPVVARMVSEHEINLSQVQGSGLGGRVTKKDLLAHLANRTAQPSPSAQAKFSAKSPAVNLQHEERQPSAATTSSTLDEYETLQPLTTMRRAIAQHMVQSKATSPHVTTIFEADMTEVVRHRESHKADFAKRGVKLNYTAYFVASAAAALREEPMVNSRFSEAGIVTHARIHVGIAVALPDAPESITDGGLIVPVIRDADEKNLQGIARAIQDLSISARSLQLGPEETRGGTFTITNHGTSGSLIGTPIINQPQAGILGVGAIVKRPVVRSTVSTLLPHADDAIVIRPMCYLNFTFDHRILDGAVADRFVARVKERLEIWPLE